jgi:hypothetical protein
VPLCVLPGRVRKRTTRGRPVSALSARSCSRTSPGISGWGQCSPGGEYYRARGVRESGALAKGAHDKGDSNGLAADRLGD